MNIQEMLIKIQKGETVNLGNLSSKASLSPEKARKFIDLVVDASGVMKEWNVVKMGALQRDIATLGVGNRKLRRIAEGSEATEEQKAGVVTDGHTLKALEVDLPETIPFSWLYDNIEGKNGETAIAKQLTKLFGNDLVDLSLNGDEDDAGAEKDFLNLNNGLIKIAKESVSTHKYDTNSSSDIKSIFKEMMKLLPNKWKSRIDLKFYVSPGTLDDYLDQVVERKTQAADKILLDGMTIGRYKGRLVRPISSMPDGVVLLTPAKNISIGMYKKDITVGRRVDVIKRSIDYMITAFHDAEYSVHDAVAIGYDII